MKSREWFWKSALVDLPAEVLNGYPVPDSSLTGANFDVEALIVEDHRSHLAVLGPHVEKKRVFYHQPSETWSGRHMRGREGEEKGGQRDGERVGEGARERKKKEGERKTGKQRSLPNKHWQQKTSRDPRAPQRPFTKGEVQLRGPEQRCLLSCERWELCKCNASLGIKQKTKHCPAADENTRVRAAGYPPPICFRPVPIPTSYWVRGQKNHITSQLTVTFISIFILYQSN